MTQAELRRIWNALDSGPVEGWARSGQAVIHVLRQYEPDRMWTRKPPDGPWEEATFVGRQERPGGVIA